MIEWQLRDDELVKFCGDPEMYSVEKALQVWRNRYAGLYPIWRSRMDEHPGKNIVIRIGKHAMMGRVV